MQIATPTISNTAPWALVTGASGRGGAAIARSLHLRGLAVVLHHTPRSFDKALKLQEEFESLRPGSSRLWCADFATDGFGTSGVPDWIGNLGIEVLICNASAYRIGELHDTERLHVGIAIHLGGHASILGALSPARTPSGVPRLKSVVAITDIAVDRSPPGQVAYTSAKGALQSMILSLACDWAPHVRFNVIQPGTLPYPPDWSDDARARKIEESIPLKRVGTFEELAAAVTFMAIDATYVTGQVLAVDGGRSRQMY